MNLVSIRIIAHDITAMAAFYAQVSGFEPTWYTEEYAEIATPACLLAIASKRTMDLFGAGAAHPADNHTAILEFRVADVDAEFARLAPLVGIVVQEPVTQPWGNRSLLFRDPEGTLVNLFTPITPAAIAKADR